MSAKMTENKMKQNKIELEAEYDLSCGQKFALWICCRKREDETDDIFVKGMPYPLKFEIPL